MIKPSAIGKLNAISDMLKVQRIEEKKHCTHTGKNESNDLGRISSRSMA